MRVARRRGRLRMPEQFADDRKPYAAASPEARIGVTQIVETDTRKPSAPRYRIPGPFEVSTGALGIISRHDVRADLVKADEQREGGRIQHHCLAPGLAVRKKQQSTLNIHVLPLEVENFAKAAPREKQEPQRGRRKRVDLREPFFLLDEVLCLGSVVVHLPGNAGGLRLADGCDNLHADGRSKNRGGLLPGSSRHGQR